MARILLIEPDWPLRHFIAGILADLGHQVRQGRGLGDFRDCIGRETFDVVATDVGFDDKTGQIAAACQVMKVLTLSGQLFVPGAPQPPRLREKPFRFDDLQALTAAVEAAQSQQLLAA